MIEVSYRTGRQRMPSQTRYNAFLYALPLMQPPAEWLPGACLASVRLPFRQAQIRSHHVSSSHTRLIRCWSLRGWFCLVHACMVVSAGPAMGTQAGASVTPQSHCVQS